MPGPAHAVEHFCFVGTACGMRDDLAKRVSCKGIDISVEEGVARRSARVP